MPHAALPQHGIGMLRWQVLDLLSTGLRQGTAMIYLFVKGHTGDVGPICYGYSLHDPQYRGVLWWPHGPEGRQ